MHRQPLIQLLQDYHQRFPAEQACCQDFLQFVQNNPQCFERSLLQGHVTGSAWLVNQAGTHVLLTHHRKLDAWLQLGGHADGDADIFNVALKEAREESGIADLVILQPTLFDLDIHRIPARNSEPSHYHYDARVLLQTVNGDQFHVSHESKALEWVSIERLADKTSELSMLRMASKYLQQFANPF